MKEESRSSSSLYESGKEDEIRQACDILVSMQYAILEPNEANQLLDLIKGKSKTPLTKEQSKSTKISQIVDPTVAVVVDPLPQLPVPGYSIDNTLLPQFPLLRELRNFIGVCSPPFEKQLTPTDVNANQSRISLNKAFVETHYLQMLNRDEKLDEGVFVTTYGPDGQEFEMNFKFWCKKTYVINSGWKDFYQRYDLKAHTCWTTIWMFRHNVTNRLCFALNWKIVLKYVGLVKRTRRKKLEITLRRE